MTVARAALAIVVAAAVWMAIVVVFGGFDIPIPPLGLRSHRLLPPAVAFAIGVAALAFAGRASLGAELESWSAATPRIATAVAIAATIAMLATATAWNTNAAGGSDSYCYLSQARLLASGAVHVEQRWVASMSWPDADRAFVPAGYVAAPTGRTIAPMCPAGFALILAAFFRIGGEPAMLLVVPLMGAALVWLTYILGCRVGTRGAAAGAAVLVAASPIVLYQAVQPMSDVPAACLWIAVLAIACRPATIGRAALAGAVSAVAVMVRPNLVPMTLVIGAWIVCDTRRASAQGALRAGVAYFAALVPGALSVAATQQAMYGSPLRSGYASLDALFQWPHAWRNIIRYPVWLVATESPLILLGLVAPFLRDDVAQGFSPAASAPRSTSGPARRRWLLLATALANTACYLLYTPFDDWWYLRFLLPAIACLVILAVITLRAILVRLSGIAAPAIAIVSVALAAAWLVHVAEVRSAFRLRASEARFIETGRYVARTRPPDAVVIAAFQSGSIRYYADRRTLAWDAVPAEWFDRAVAHLSEQGLAPAIVLESWEEPRFRAAFAGRSQYGDLDWPPRAQIGRDVRVYDPADRARYRAGQPVATERIWIGLRQ